MKYSYKILGNLLVALRKKAAIAQQSDLAAMMKTTQQTISRWESGASRPRDKQMPLLAKILKADLDELLAAAGYTTKMPVATFDKPFPVDALTPDTFERFCLYFLAQQYPTAKVHRAGQSGHTQDGIDIDVIFSNRNCYTFQCRRVEEFGPAKVHTTVAEHKRKAKKKFILLSRVASPQARQAIGEHTNWDIWDKEDISRHVRHLAKETQLKLVDTFFRGQRLTLLGETEPGPWQTSEDFFAPFMSEQGVFSHTWNLIGRTQETNAIAESLGNSDIQALFLIGAGGAGKSRLLKQSIQVYESNNTDVLVRFLSPTEEVNNKGLEDLGSGRKLLIVDDAHDRSDLQLLFQYASIPTNKAMLFLSFRPYGLNYIKSQASNFALAGERISEVKLVSLTIEQATALAKQVLNKFNGPVDIAKNIARLTLDCPLATVIGAQVVAKEKIHFELAKNEEAFRTTLFGKFQDIIAGEIGNKSDAEPIKKLLRILALLQPFHPEDASIAKVAESIEGVNIPEVNRLIRLLIDAGVLFKRGGKYQLSPDLLADYIIEGSCIGQNGSSIGYAEKVFDVTGNEYIEHLLLNLGKLDWRLRNGDPSNSRLLDGIWRKLQPSLEYSDPHIKAVTAAAYYQPVRALDFAERFIREGKYLRDLANLIKYAAYNFGYLQRACECLWELGKSDKRALNQHPGHAIRVLTELCEIEPNKPREYNETVVNFALSLIDNPDSWTQAYTPLDILGGILRTEGHISESNNRSISFKPFFISFDFASPLRIKVIDAAIKLLSDKNTKVAILAANFLQKSIRYPSGQFNIHATSEVRDIWTKEFAQTLGKIKQKIDAQKLDPLVLIEIVRSITWHAHHAGGDTAPIAKEIIALMPDSLDFRTILMLSDGYGSFLERISTDYEKHKQEVDEYLKKLANELVSAYPDAGKLRAFIAHHLSHIEANKGISDTSPFILYRQLIHSSPALAQITIDDAIVHPESKTKQFAAMSLAELLAKNHANGLLIAKRLLDSNLYDLQAAVGRAYSGLTKFTAEDILILKKLLSANDPGIAGNAVDVVRNIAQNDQRLAVELLKCVDIGMSNRLADEVLVQFLHIQKLPLKLLTDDDIKAFLDRLIKLDELNGYWVETFLSHLSKSHAVLVANFFMTRVERSVNIRDYRPCNYGPYGHVPLYFRESPEFGMLLRQVAVWMKSRESGKEDENYWFNHYAALLFNTMFHPFDSELIEFLQNWVDGATQTDMDVIRKILGNAPPDLVFQHKEFVIRFLNKAKQYGKDTLTNAEDALFSSAVSGVRTGIPGEPFPRDIQMKKEAENTLNELSRFSAAYRLYEMIKRHAEQGIRWSLQEREAFEE